MLQTSYEAKTKDVWVFIETKDGKARNVGLELLNPGRRLAGIQGGKAVALVIGHNCEDAVKEAIAHGADKVLLVDNEVYGHYSTDAYTAAIVHCVEADCPTTILMGASPLGRDLGPRVAGRLKTGLTADCTSLDIDEATGKVCLDPSRVRRQPDGHHSVPLHFPPDRHLPSWRE
ncbi:MAG: electron transfer flavoprotein subunit alpha/FixB family protein [Evtepia gabavorous]